MEYNTKNMFTNLIIVGSWIVIIYTLINLIHPTFKSVSADVLINDYYEDIDLAPYLEKINNSDDDSTSPVLYKTPPSTIKLLRTKTNSIEEVDIETYIEGVVAAEMPTNFELEALKAQAVVSRGFTFSSVLNSSKHTNADICDSYKCCQAYDPSKVTKTVKQAIRETRGFTPMLAGDYAETLYFASTLEGTLTNAQVWGNENKFTSIYRELEGPSPESNILPKTRNAYPHTTSTVTLSISSFVKSVNSLYPNANVTTDNIKDNVKVLSRTKGGFVDKLKLGNITLSGSDVRYKLVKDLKSSNFSIDFEGSNIVFTSKGYGHGAGMSQWGANALAQEGKNFKEIINYYFQNLSIKQLY